MDRPIRAAGQRMRSIGLFSAVGGAARDPLEQRLTDRVSEAVAENHSVVIRRTAEERPAT